MPKKVLVQDSRKQPTSPMSPPYANTLSTASSTTINASPGDEDEDDICPVCESECTCHNRGSQSIASRSIVPMRTSIFTSTSYSPPNPTPPQPQPTMQPLKIKLTVPPNLRFHKNLASSSSATRSHPPQPYTDQSLGRAEQASTSVTMPQQVALSLLDPSGPKRRGRPPKAVVAAREAAKAALASAHASYGGGTAPRPAPRKGTRVTATSVKHAQSYTGNKRGAYTKPTKKAIGKRPVASSLPTSYSSEDDTRYPTFMSAASTSSLTSSSESQSLESTDSSESSSDSEQGDSLFLEKGRAKKDTSGPDPSQKRRDHASGNRWEIKPRKQSVGPEEYVMDADSEDTSDDEDNADDEDDSDDEDEEDDEEENAAEADVEEEGLAEVEDEPEVGEMDGKLGVSFGGDGWSEDEESSFDADIFFANLDDSSDSCGSPAALRLDSFGSDMGADPVSTFSGDEEDALLLMDVDTSMQVRRSMGEFEVGLDGLVLGLDGQLLLPANFAHFAAFEGGFGDSNETDVDMTISQNGSSTEDEAADSDTSGLLLEETDGETTEDELVDSNGLPNSKAMMLFRWPEALSTIDPQSTVTRSSDAEDAQESPQASHSLPLALQSMNDGHGSPAANSDARLSMEEYEDGAHHGGSLRMYESDAGRTPGVPIMGQFVTAPTIEAPRIAIIDGNHAPIPSPFPRSRTFRTKPRKPRLYESASGLDFTTDSEAHRRSSSSTLFVSVNPPSSDDFGSQSHAQTSDDPSSTDAIDLDDVLDASFLDTEPGMFEPSTPSQDNWLSPSTSTASAPIENLNRWDRIPVGTFRRTRETSLLESTPGSDTGLASLYPAIGVLLNNDMLGTPKSRASTLKVKAKKSSKVGTSSTLVISPVLLPVRDGDRTPTGNGLYNPFQQNDPPHQQKPRKEVRKEKAMMKRKMIGKHAPQPSARSYPHAHRHHYPNMKSRGSSSVQRMQSASSSHVPHLNL